MEQLLNRTHIKLSPDRSRVLIRPFFPYSDNGNSKVISRILSMSDMAVIQEFNKVHDHFYDRHFDIDKIFNRHFRLIEHLIPEKNKLSNEKKLLLGAYFTSEYSLESAALFNPSIVAHPDQSGLKEGATRFIISLRAVGEGHISSVTFREGIIHSDLSLTIESPWEIVTTPDSVQDAEYSRVNMGKKFKELKLENRYTHLILEHLPEPFTESDLNKCLKLIQNKSPKLAGSNDFTRDNIRLLLSTNYQVEFDQDIPLSARVIFPNSHNERKGIEDARFVRFISQAGETTFYAMYTAWSGTGTSPQMMETKDFLHFKMSSLHGDSINDKGMALFPQQIDNKFVSLARQDGENLYLIYSDNIKFWRESIPLLHPKYSWELIKVGNCGSPILLEEGWLVITHGVGPMRRYCLGAILLDKQDPSKVIGRLEQPLLEPNENEREGYVPNVVYSCGCMAFNGQLILPYAMSDYSSRIALIDIKNLLTRLD